MKPQILVWLSINDANNIGNGVQPKAFGYNAFEHIPNLAGYAPLSTFCLVSLPLNEWEANKDSNVENRIILTRKT